MSEHIASRRQPSQQRSRERHDRILAAAKSLIAGKGSDRVKMSEVAALAQMSIGSLYQYFPDKGAIVRTLAERYSAESRACIEQALAAGARPGWSAGGLRGAWSTSITGWAWPTR